MSAVPNVTDDLAEQKKQMALGWTIAKEMVMDNQDWYKIAYDRDSAEFKPRVGDWVLYRDKSKTGTLAPQWSGPYEIVDIFSPNVRLLVEKGQPFVVHMETLSIPTLEFVASNCTILSKWKRTKLNKNLSSKKTVIPRITESGDSFDKEGESSDELACKLSITQLDAHQSTWSAKEKKNIVESLNHLSNENQKYAWLPGWPHKSYTPAEQYTSEYRYLLGICEWESEAKTAEEAKTEALPMSIMA